MKYSVRIGDTIHEVEVDGTRVLVDGVALDADLAAVGGGGGGGGGATPLYHLLLGGASWTVTAQLLEGPGRWALGMAGERIEVTVEDERDRAKPPQGRTGGAVGGGGTVRAPMPGLVLRVEVAEGQRVDAGAGLVVVEAMKMENELRAGRAAVVQKVHVAVGQAVEKGAPLVTLASPEP